MTDLTSAPDDHVAAERARARGQRALEQIDELIRERDALKAEVERLADELRIAHGLVAVAEAVKALAVAEEWSLRSVPDVTDFFSYAPGEHNNKRRDIAYSLLDAGLDWREPKKPTIAGFATDADIEAWGL